MADKDINVYLNDQLTGAILGSRLARQVQARHRGTQLGEVMSSSRRRSKRIARRSSASCSGETRP